MFVAILLIHYRDNDRRAERYFLFYFFHATKKKRMAAFLFVTETCQRVCVRVCVHFMCLP